jgi:hypothetical protein
MAIRFYEVRAKSNQVTHGLKRGKGSLIDLFLAPAAQKHKHLLKVHKCAEKFLSWGEALSTHFMPWDRAWLKGVPPRVV